MIEKIKRVGLREVWRHEARDFTTWLEDNTDVLNDVLDIQLNNIEREKSAGNFNVDLVAEDNSGSMVIIENQLAKSNHDHLGKLITYLSTMEAKTAIWIVSDPRPEHVTAITWLNESTAASFYLIKLEAIKVGDSDPAPLLTLIVGPSEEGKKRGKKKKDIAERHILRRKFWEALLEYAKTKTKLHANISPGNDSWVGTGAGKSGLSYNYIITKNDAAVELYIDRGKEREKENLKIFNALKKNEPQINKSIGGLLDWQELKGKRACRIKKILKIGGRDNEENWPEIQKRMVDAMVHLEKALQPHIKNLRI